MTRSGILFTLQDAHEHIEMANLLVVFWVAPKAIVDKPCPSFDTLQLILLFFNINFLQVTVRRELESHVAIVCPDKPTEGGSNDTTKSENVQTAATHNFPSSRPRYKSLTITSSTLPLCEKNQ